MKRIAIATAALVGLTGAAYAQEAPALSGNYSASVQTRHSDGSVRGGYSYGGDRYYVRRDYDRYDRPRYRYRDYYAGYYDPYDRPYRYHRNYYRPAPGVSFSFGGPGWRVGYHDYYWR